MTIDLSTLKIGDKVIHRDGEEATISYVKISSNHQPPWVRLDIHCPNGVIEDTYYQLNGLYILDMESKWDIVKIIPKEEV